MNEKHDLNIPSQRDSIFIDKIRLAENREDNMKYEKLADLYSILAVLEQVETLYMRDTITSQQYVPTCTKLISQYNSWIETNSDLVPSIDDFVTKYNINCKTALLRLRSGIPQTGLNDTNNNKNKEYDTSEILTITELFITVMDAVRLNMIAVDQIFIPQKDILDSLHRIKSIPATHEVPTKIQYWVTTLSQMRASDSLTEEQVRQLAFDQEQTYSQFKKFIT